MERRFFVCRVDTSAFDTAIWFAGRTKIRKSLSIKVCLGALIITSLILGPVTLEGTRWAFLIRLLGITELYAVLALGLNIALGYTGLLDLGYMAFYAIGAYITALILQTGISFWLALPCAVLAAGVIRLLIGIPALRLKGDYLAIVTLGFGEIIRIILNNWDNVTNGPKGISLLAGGIAPTTFFGLPLTQNIHFHYLILFCLIASCIICRRLENSKIGRAWNAIREDETAAELTGVPVNKMKMLAFVFSSAFAGVAGAIFARWENFVTPESFTFWESVLLVAMVVLGGMGRIPGVLAGVVLVSGFPEILREFLGSKWADARYFIFGLALIAAVRFRYQKQL